MLELSPGTLFLVLLLIALLSTSKKIQKIMIMKKREDLRAQHVVHECTQFFSALSIEHKDWLNSQEKDLRVSHGINRVPEEKLSQMMAAPDGRKQIIGVPFYDILDNQEYRNRFEYAGARDLVREEVNAGLHGSIEYEDSATSSSDGGQT